MGSAEISMAFPTRVIALCADPNFGFMWNKESFRNAGLDPDRPPTTIRELDAGIKKAFPLVKRVFVEGEARRT
jgi:hypothetical protein